MKNRLILLCAPSGTGKTTLARMLVATDRRFKHVMVLTTRKVRPDEIGRSEKTQVTIEELKRMKRENELVNFNEKDDVVYGIRQDAIADILNKGLYPVLEWDINRIDHFNDIFPVVRIIIQPHTADAVLERIKDGRDPEGKRKSGVLTEIEGISSEKFKADIIIINQDAALTDTLRKIRRTIFRYAVG